ncbi:hypothetical protein MRB53_027475 [Persea americana]|uniref:Uncharacterized protein n=1 Tax=Persea americana TaxID=3435 RepID=A0ACC2LM58_PERAE|nr:hypothetical protein MRB53_027475 [Persea americana]
MESRKVLILVLVVTAIALLAPYLNNGVEVAFGIELNPCTTAECKKVLQEKYTSATSFKGKFCICLG